MCEQKRTCSQMFATCIHVPTYSGGHNFSTTLGLQKLEGRDGYPVWGCEGARLAAHAHKYCTRILHGWPVREEFVGLYDLRAIIIFLPAAVSRTFCATSAYCNKFLCLFR